MQLVPQSENRKRPAEAEPEVPANESENGGLRLPKKARQKRSDAGKSHKAYQMGGKRTKAIPEAPLYPIENAAEVDKA